MIWDTKTLRKMTYAVIPFHGSISFVNLKNISPPCTCFWLISLDELSLGRAVNPSAAYAFMIFLSKVIKGHNF